jgi:hypothetical protein
MKSQLAGEVVVRVKMTQAGHLQFVASNQHGFRLFSRHRIDASGPGWPCGSKTGGLAEGTARAAIVILFKILAAALLAATPACAGTISLTCARPTGSYKVQVASTGAVTLLPAYGAPATFAGGDAPTGRTRIRNTLNTVERVPIRAASLMTISPKTISPNMTNT